MVTPPGSPSLNLQQKTRPHPAVKAVHASANELQDVSVRLGPETQLYPQQGQALTRPYWPFPSNGTDVLPPASYAPYCQPSPDERTPLHMLALP